MVKQNFAYKMTLSLNVYRHLGVGLYSNIPSVLSEAVANAWDADAEHVNIDVDVEKGKITISDDGIGMSREDANNRYLRVGYERRKDPEHQIDPERGAVTKKGRRVMGRKGIGKMSLFSIAKIIDIYSRKKDDSPHGFRMSIKDIEHAIKEEGEHDYKPQPIEPSEDMAIGTTIVLSDMKRDLVRTTKALRRRLARRFSIIGSAYEFEVSVNGEPITMADRGYAKHLRYAWTFEEKGEAAIESATRIEQRYRLNGTIDGTEYKIDGWIATAWRSTDLKDSEAGDTANKIVIMVNGKLGQEDVLEELGEGGLYSKYLIGEIHADFLDRDDMDDSSTSSRQKIMEDDLRYGMLKAKIQRDLKTIGNKWLALRIADGEKQAFDIEGLKEWYGSLDSDHREAAKRLFKRIFTLPIDDRGEMRQLLAGGIMTFEILKLRHMLDKLDSISIENVSSLSSAFEQLNTYEASAYYRIIKNRLAMVRKLELLSDEDATEKMFRKHLYKNLWLLDPSWEPVTVGAAYQEKRIYKALHAEAKSLSKEQQQMRLDIKYSSTTSNKHVIIELKRASVAPNLGALIDQVERYHGAVGTVLKSLDNHGTIEVICVVGKLPPRMKEQMERFQASLRAFNARIVTYDSLIQNAMKMYGEYLDRETDADKLHKLVQSIEEYDAPNEHS